MRLEVVLVDSAQTYRKDGIRENFWGAAVASETFAEALIHGPRTCNLTIVDECHKEGQPQPISDANVEVMGVETFVRRFRGFDNVVIQSLNTGIGAACHLRWLARNPRWSIAGMTHDLFDSHVFHQLISDCALTKPHQDSIVCCSRSAQAVLRNLLNKVDLVLGREHAFELPVVPHGVAKPIAEALTKSVARDQLRLDRNSTVFLYVGRISQFFKADLLGLTDVFCNRFRDHDAKLIIAGGVSDKQSDRDLQKLHHKIQSLGLTDRVIVFPNITPEIKHRLFSAADVFVSPANSLQESFGLALVEAMLYQLPVIATEWDGYRDIVEQGETGFLVPVSFNQGSCASDEFAPLLTRNFLAEDVTSKVKIDWREFGRKMERLFLDRQLRERFGWKGAQRARKLFSWETVVPMYEEVWRHALLQREGARWSPSDLCLPIVETFGPIFQSEITANICPK